MLVKDVYPGQSQYYPYEVYSANVAGLTNFKGMLYFAANDAANGRGLWKSDGAVDTPILVGGKLTITIANAARGDRLEIVAVDSISTAGNLVLNAGVVIGTFSGGIDKVSLQIELNQNAALPAVQALLRSIGYRSHSQHPDAVRRTIRFNLTDGDGAAAVSQSVQADVIRGNDPPVLSLSGTLGYVRDQAATALAPYARVSDVDNANFNAGRLRVWIDTGSSNSNRLAIGGGFVVDAAQNVLFNGTIIGKRTSSCFGTSELIVVFNSNTTPAIVQQLVRAIMFKTVGGSAGQRSVRFTVSDGSGGLSAEALKTVNVMN